MKLKMKSSNLSEIDYEPTTKTLIVNFHSGGSYKYVNVLMPTISELIVSESQGKYFNQNIKGKYGESKI